MSRRPGLIPLLFFAACGGDGDGDGGSAVDVPTFAADIAPIVYSSCSPCHRPGSTTPFTLLGYDDVRKRQKQIAEVTAQRIMPPWLPSQGDFADDRRLDEAELAMLLRWIEAGTPRGDVAVEPPPPSFRSGWQLREPDLIVTTREGLIVPAAGPDAFRNLVIPIDVDRVRFVEAVEILPDSAAVHHAVLAVDRTREARRLDELDPGPGFSGMLLGNAEPPDGHFLGWTPGKRVHRSEPGMAWRLWPGNDLVLQLHLTPTGREERVRARIGLYFTAVPTTVIAFPLVLFCDDIDIAAGVTDYVVRDHFVLPVAAAIHSVYPHAHYLCRQMRATVTPPGGAARDLFRIDRWDFDWQDDYRFRRPIELAAGTRIDFEY
ncbi:MAG: hypothetical protein KDC98_06030, partial [Planctomycetes bacterium]|nr:hypothetical protein [Planctomycetota bacterium]